MIEPVAEIGAMVVLRKTVQMWNALADQGMTGMLVSSARMPLVDLLSVPFTDVEISVLLGERIVADLGTLDVLTAVAASRVVACESDPSIRGKRLPGGWKTERDSYTWFMAAVNSRTRLTPGSSVAAYVLKTAATGSPGALAQAIAHVTRPQWQRMLEALS